MKPFDGGAWVGVTRITSPEELQAAYDASGERLMHLQAAVEDYDVFTRSLSIGPQTAVAEYEPARQYFERYAPNPDLSPERHREIESVSRVVNAFFRWELNSCEVIVKGDDAYPIDYANASPDLSLVSLNYLFPWAIASLVRWCAFCCLTGRSMRINQNIADYVAIAETEGLSYEEKLERYRALADCYFEREKFEEFAAEVLPHLDELMAEELASPEFDALLVDVITRGEPAELHERLIDRCRTRVADWAADRSSAAPVDG